MIKAVLFDIGNVIVRWSPENLYARLIPDTTERAFFLNNVCSMTWHTRHDEGTSFADNRAALLKDWPQYQPLIEAFDARFEEMLDGAIPETEAVMAELGERGVPLYALTNMPNEKAELVFSYIKHFNLFRDVVISAHEKLIKPDPAIYHLTLERLRLEHPRLEAHEVFFTDDSRPNIDAANALGFTTYHFTDPAGLRPALVAAGVLS